MADAESFFSPEVSTTTAVFAPRAQPLLWLGVCFGIAVFVPYLGRFAHIPTRPIGVILAVLGAAGFLLFGRRSLCPPRSADLVLLLIMLALGALVLQSASREQLLYVLSPLQWLGHAGQYYGSKIVVFLVTYLPFILMLVVVISLDDRDTKPFCRGLYYGMLLVAAAALVRMLPYAPKIFSNDVRISWAFFSDLQRGYAMDSLSLVFGPAVLLSVASVATAGDAGMARRLLNAALALVFMYCLYLTNQRADVIVVVLLVATLIVVCIVQAVRSRAKRSHWLFLSAPIAALIFGVMIVALSTPATRDYWSQLIGPKSEGINARLKLVDEGVQLLWHGSASSGHPSHMGQAELVNNDDPTPKPWTTGEIRRLLFGAGAGAFAKYDPVFLYSHILFLDILVEHGALALFTAILMIVLAYVLWCRRVAAGNTMAIGFGAVGVFTILHVVKAGDLAELGIVLFIPALAAKLASAAPPSARVS